MKVKNPAYQFDLEVVKLYLMGDMKAQKWLYKNMRQYIAKMLQIARSEGIIFSENEDVVSEIIYKIMVANDCRILRRYSGECKLTTYLWRIIRNYIIDAYRKEFAFKSREQVVDEFENMEQVRKVDVNEVEVILAEHISHIPPLDRFIIISRWLEKLSYDQIIIQAKQKFPKESSLNKNRIAYILFTNRKALQKKLKKYVFS